MTDICEVPRCRGEAALVYLGHGICNTHWNELTADDAPADALRMVLGVEADVSDAKEKTMATKKKSAKKKTKAVAAKKVTKAAAAKKEDQPKGPKPGRVFAIRVTDDELAAIHRTAGPRNATRFIRAVAAAFASEDESAFKVVLKEAREART